MKNAVSKMKNVNVDEIHEYQRNAKKHPKMQIQQIVESIKRFGFLTPLLIDDKNNLICGHGRLRAAKLLDMKKVPCVLAEHLSESERRAFVHIENRLQESGGASWDSEMLKLELEDLSINCDFDMAPMGFSPEEIEKLIPLDDPFMPDFPKDNGDGTSKISYKLTVECRDSEEKQALFNELVDRNFIVKAV